MKTRRFQYAGDDETSNRVVSWFQAHLRGVGTCVEAELPEAALVLLYSGIDTFGLLAAPSGTDKATRCTFVDWCDNYIASRLQSVDGERVSGLDLYGARCGVLHTSTPVSDLGRKGETHEIWYQFRGKSGFNLMANMKLQPLIVDVETLALAFKAAGIACITDLNADPARLQAADGRAQLFLRWGIRQ